MLRKLILAAFFTLGTMSMSQTSVQAAGTDCDVIQAQCMASMGLFHDWGECGSTYPLWRSFSCYGAVTWRGVCCGYGEYCEEPVPEWYYCDREG